MRCCLLARHRAGTLDLIARAGGEDFAVILSETE